MTQKKWIEWSYKQLSLKVFELLLSRATDLCYSSFIFCIYLFLLLIPFEKHCQPISIKQASGYVLNTNLHLCYMLQCFYTMYDFHSIFCFSFIVTFIYIFFTILRSTRKCLYSEAPKHVEVPGLTNDLMAFWILHSYILMKWCLHC